MILALCFGAANAHPQKLRQPNYEFTITSGQWKMLRDRSESSSSMMTNEHNPKVEPGSSQRIDPVDEDADSAE